jgi:hypothetical protein
VKQILADRVSNQFVDGSVVSESQKMQLVLSAFILGQRQGAVSRGTDSLSLGHNRSPPVHGAALHQPTLAVLPAEAEQLAVFEGDENVAGGVDGGAAFHGVGGQWVNLAVLASADVKADQLRLLWFVVGVECA